MYLANKKVEEELLDLHNGLHMAMENLIRSKNYDEAERILRIIDQRMSSMINEIKVIK